MNTRSFTVPMLVLFGGGIWIDQQFRAIATLQQQNAQLRSRLETPPPSAPARQRPAGTSLTALDREPVDWEMVARQLADAGGPGLATSLQLQDRLESMSAGELATALDEIDRAGLPRREREALQLKLGLLLMAKDPVAGLDRFVHRCHEDDWDWRLGGMLSKWAGADPDAAVDWFADQLAAGAFDNQGVEGGLKVPGPLVTMPFYALLDATPAAAERLLATLPQSKRQGFLGALGLSGLSEQEQVAWVGIVRRQLPPDSQPEVVAWPTQNWSDGDGSRMTLVEVDAYLDRIEATPEEREACLLSAVRDGEWPQQPDPGNPPTAADPPTVAVIDALRTWLAERAPGVADRATGEALVRLGHRGMNYQEVADLAIHCLESGAGDPLLVPLLDYHQSGNHPEVARTLAARLSDAELRQRYLREPR